MPLLFYSGLEVHPALCLKWRVCARSKSADYTFSSAFRFQGKRCRLAFNFCEGEYRLRLQNLDEDCHDPFDAVVEVVNGSTAQIMPELNWKVHWWLSRYKYFLPRKKYEGFKIIWRQTEADIARGYPEFHRDDHELRFRVMLKSVAALAKGEQCACATCKFTEADDNVPSLESFSKYLGDLLDQKASADVEFRCVDADDNILTTVKAHKLIVCARSPVLASMLNSDMVEGRTGVATIKDIDADVFKQFLKYLYSGKLDKTTVDTTMGLYEAGDRFQVKSLTKHCARRLARKLTIKNCFEVLVLAVTHGDMELGQATLSFMVNMGLPFRGWEQFCSSHPSLSRRFLNRFYKLFEEMFPEDKCNCSKLRMIA